MAKRILIVGPGALGSFYGVFLQESGFCIEVCVRDKQHYLDQWDIQSPKKSYAFKPNCFWNLSELERNTKTYTAILVCTKVLNQEDLIEQLLAYKHINETPILLMQNGYGLETLWQKKGLGANLARALAFICVYRQSPKKVTHLDYGDVVLGNDENNAPDWLEDLCKAWVSQGIGATISDDLLVSIWQKQLWNVPFSSCGVSYELSTKALLTDQAIKKQIKAMMLEVCQVAKLDGVVIDESFCDFMIEQTQKMIDYKSSMLLDYEAGRPMELDCILGSVIKKAQISDFDIPLMSQIYQELKTKEPSSL